MQVIADRIAILRQYDMRNTSSQLEFDNKLCRHESKRDLCHQFLTMHATQNTAPSTSDRTALRGLDWLQRRGMFASCDKCRP
jgi:hypothetical protein